MISQHNFFDNYLLLKPKEANVFDLVHLLFSSSLLERKRFIECPAELPKYTDFRRRWLIFISVLAQKLLLLLNTPMAKTGHALEMCLNLFSSNGGFLRLLRNLFKGEVVWPDRSSATFVSLVGNLDRRIDLGRNIRPGDRKYKASLSVMAAKLSYENEAFIKTTVEKQWQMEFMGFYNFWNEYQGDFSAQAFVVQDKLIDPNLIVLAFRGTDPFNAGAWRADVDISWYELKNVGKVHGGFMKALGLQRDQGWPKEIQPSKDGKLFAYYTLRGKLKEILKKNKIARFIVTGHSLGGALAILLMAVLALHEEKWLLDRLEGVYTFGQPRVGDRQFGEFMEEKLRKYDVKYFRYVYCNDMVPRMPYDDKTLLFKHFGPCLYFNSCYKGKVLGEEPNKNYFSLLWVIPNYINAVWELIRSFTIQDIEGPEYREGWFMRASRVFGLVIPGLPAHASRDYVNSIRLGSLPLDPVH
ncbi:hypothetical protein SLE2022_214170 [Rubroshorea leprosula]